MEGRVWQVQVQGTEVGSKQLVLNEHRRVVRDVFGQDTEAASHMECPTDHGKRSGPNS